MRKSAPQHKPNLFLQKILDDKIGSTIAPNAQLGNVLGIGALTPLVNAQEMETQEITADGKTRMTPTEEELTAYRQLCGLFFGELGSGLRRYASAKLALRQDVSRNAPEALQAFIDNTSEDIDNKETRAVGWEPVKAMVMQLSSAMFGIKHTASKSLMVPRGGDVAVARARREDALAYTKQEKIIAPLVKFYREHGLCAPDATDENLTDYVKEVLPFWEKLVETTMQNGPAGHQLMAAMDRKINGKPLTVHDDKTLQNNHELVEEWCGILGDAGLGFATAPCNQVYRNMHDTVSCWDKYIRTELQSRIAFLSHESFKAQELRREAIGYHTEVLEQMHSLSQAINPVCETLGSMIDYNATIVISSDDTAKVKSTVARMGQINMNARLEYDAKRLQDSLNAVLKHAPNEVKLAEKYCERVAIISTVGPTLQQESGALFEQLDKLNQRMENGIIDISSGDEDFRKVSFGIRSMRHRLEMMQMMTEGLYADMTKVSGKDEKGWGSQWSADDFTPPENPSNALKDLAGRIQHYCVKVQAEATKRLNEMDALTKTFTSSDSFDQLLDVFQRVKSETDMLSASLQNREDHWKRTNTGQARRT